MDIVHSKGKNTWYTRRLMGDNMSPEKFDTDIALIDYARHREMDTLWRP